MVTADRESITLPWHRVTDVAYYPSIPGYYFEHAEAPEKLYGGSVGGTKTTTLAVCCIKLSLKYANNRGFVGERDFDDLRRGLWAEIQSWLPSDPPKMADGSELYQINKSEHWIRFYNGSEIHAVELKDEPRNVNLGWAAIDQAERVPYTSLNWMRTRLRANHVPYRPLMLSANPEPGWVKEEFIDSAAPEKTGIMRLNGEELIVYRKGPRKLFVPAFPEDNEHLPEGYIEGLYESLPAALVESLLKGRWDVVENGIYSQLERAVHLREREADRPIVKAAIGVDYGEVHPSAVYVVGEDALGYTWVLEGYQAVTRNDDDFDDLLSKVNEYRAKWNVPASRVGVDPMLKGWDHTYGFHRCDSSPGARKVRIGNLTTLFNGKVTRAGQPRIPSMYFDVNGEGVMEAFNQALVYKWEFRETDSVIERIPVRKDDDRVAAVEMGNEALHAGGMEYGLRSEQAPKHESNLERYRRQQRGNGVTIQKPGV